MMISVADDGPGFPEEVIAGKAAIHMVSAFASANRLVFVGAAGIEPAASTV